MRTASSKRGSNALELLRVALAGVSTPLNLFVLVIVIVAAGWFGLGSVTPKENRWVLDIGAVIIVLVILMGTFYLLITGRSWELYGRNPLEQTLAQNLATTIFGPLAGHFGNLRSEREQVEAFAEAIFTIEDGLVGEHDAVKKFRHYLSASLHSQLRRQDNQAHATAVLARIEQMRDERRRAVID